MVKIMLEPTEVMSIIHEIFGASKITQYADGSMLVETQDETLLKATPVRKNTRGERAAFATARRALHKHKKQ